MKVKYTRLPRECKLPLAVGSVSLSLATFTHFLPSRIHNLAALIFDKLCKAWYNMPPRFNFRTEPAIHRLPEKMYLPRNKPPCFSQKEWAKATEEFSIFRGEQDAKPP